MKKKLTLLLLPLLLVGCNETANIEHVLVLDYAFNFSQQENKAELLLNDAHYIFPSEINLDRPVVAGDELSVIFDGDYEITCSPNESGECLIKGNIKSYKLIETYIRAIHVDDTTIKEIADTIRGEYILDNENIILDTEGNYISLDEYDGNELFLSINLKKTNEYCVCPEGMECGPCPSYVAGLYAYDPRPPLE